MSKKNINKKNELRSLSNKQRENYLSAFLNWLSNTDNIENNKALEVYDKMKIINANEYIKNRNNINEKGCKA